MLPVTPVDGCSPAPSALLEVIMNSLHQTAPWTVIDLFSGAGGMSYGFHAHSNFKLVGAADAEIGKPSTGFGALDCNGTYEANLGIRPLAVDLSEVDPDELYERFAPGLRDGRVDVLSACPPCTGFSRANSENHLRDDPRNSLVARTALYVRRFRPRVLVMENARELVTGRFVHHIEALTEALQELGYEVSTKTHMLTSFGLPQVRERAVVVAVERPLVLRTLEDLWDGYAVNEQALTVRRAIGHLPPIAAGEADPNDPAHTCTHSDGLQLRRLVATPADGGSWIDWTRHPAAMELLIPSMQRSIEAGTTNHFCDVYGRMAWDRPAPTIKRECSHIGNGRYAHPDQHRLCSVREMALLNGFPAHFRFVGRSRKNLYRAIGDAVPPLVSYQLAHVAEWVLTGERPALRDSVLAGTHLLADDLVKKAVPASPARAVTVPASQMALF
jgi:DNA (cytosine-5)-methyltransferase 1